MKFIGLSVLLGASLAAAQAGQYQQCGGTGYGGPTSCSDGWACICQNEWYSQCLPPGSNPGGWNQAGCQSGSGGGGGGSSASTVRPPNNFLGSSTFATSVRPDPTPAPPPSGGSGGGGNGISGRATTTHYYDGQKGACGCGNDGGMFAWQANRPDGFFTAAGSMPLFSGGSGSNTEWCGNGCGACYRLTSTGAPPQPGTGSPSPLTSIQVMVTNLCPAVGNEQWCNVPQNQYGYQFHFDLMNAPPGWDNPVVEFESIPCPGALASDYQKCQCQGGRAVF